MSRRTTRTSVSFAAAALLGGIATFSAPSAVAVGEGPSCCTNGTVNTSILHTYDSMVAEL